MPNEDLGPRVENKENPKTSGAGQPKAKNAVNNRQKRQETGKSVELIGNRKRTPEKRK